MKKAIFLSFTFAALGACSPDETISGFVDPAATYQLTLLNSAPFTDRATVQFPDEGTLTGQGPCNGFQAVQTAPYPWFALGPIAATRRACPALQAENTYLEALASMTFAEIAGPVLILSNADDGEMVFQAD